MFRLLWASGLLLIALGGRLLALDPSQPVGSYLRANFTKQDGLPSSIVYVVLQTKNGFLWVGTHGGLSRFDGTHFTSVEFSPAVAAEGLTQALAEGPDGDLWVGTNAGALRIPSAALQQFGPLPSTVYHPGVGASDTVTVLHFGRNGVLWAGTDKGLYRLEHGSFSLVLADASVSRIEETSSGHLLIITSEGFVEWDGRKIVSHADLTVQLGTRTNGIFHVMEDHSGSLWFCTAAGVVREVNGSFERLQPFGEHVSPAAYRAFEDPQGNVWLVMDDWLFRAVPHGYERVPVHARYVYSDRDGDLWVATSGDGLIRLKDRVVRMFNAQDGLPGNVVTSTVSATAGQVWVGNHCGGISLFDGNKAQTYNEKEGLSNSCVFALAVDQHRDV